MKKIFILISSTFLLASCIESVAVLGGGAVNGKVAQSSMQSIASYGIKRQTGKTPVGHAISYIKKEKSSEKQKPCLSFVNKKDSEVCLMVEKRIISKQDELKEKKFFNKPSKKLTLSLQSSINEKSKIKYLD
jgi:hypothetical protein